MAFDSPFPERLRQRREALQITQRELARMLNVSATIITFWECGRSVPRLDNCVAIADALGVSIDYLAGRCDA